MPRNMDIPVVKYMLIVAGRRNLVGEVLLYITEVNPITGSWQEDYWFQSSLHSKDGSKPSRILGQGLEKWDVDSTDLLN